MTRDQSSFTPPPYLAALDLHARRCVVVGGGRVAERKVRGLLDSGAVVSVIAPHITPGLGTLAAAGSITAVMRPYKAGDLEGAALVIAATDQRDVNARVAEEARRVGALVNVVDAPDTSDFTTPATLCRGGITVGVSTDRNSPVMAALIRDRLASALSEGIVTLAQKVGALRTELHAANHHFPAHRWRAAITEETLFLAEQGHVDAAITAIRFALDQPGAGVARVSLVGAGPGDAGLLTVRGRERLREADVVIYDRLINPALLSEAPPDAERVYVGKLPRAHAQVQETINTLLVTHARAGKRVVRLKGGDPFVFGRGGEEAEALTAAGIPFEVVPGISSAIAVPAYAGIPVTHRQIATSFTVVTGSEARADGGIAYDWSALAKTGTLVFLMGVAHLPIIADQLIMHGLAADTPAAVIEWGTWDCQRVVSASLGDLHREVIAQGIGAPATIIVGQVVRLRERLRWFDPHIQTP